MAMRQNGRDIMVFRVLVLMVAAGVLAACQSGNRTQVSVSPYSNGGHHSEPVFFNGKHYTVAFRYRASANVYDVTVSGKGGRRLGGKPGDREVVEQIAGSAVRHFACANGQKAHVVPGTSRHTGRAWSMSAACV